MATRKRRSNGEGTIFFDKSRGRWIALISLPDGRRKKASALTQKEARLKLVEMLADLENHGAVFDQRSRFQELSSLWRAKVVEAKPMAPKTREMKRWALDRLDSLLGDVKLVDLNAERIEGALEVMAAEGLSRESLNKIKSVLNQLCVFGERRGLLRKNPVSIVELPGNLPERKQRRSLTVDQATTLLEASSGDRLHALWATMLMLGLRPGEATALQWDAVDLDNLVLHVRKNLRKVDTVFELSDELKTKRSRRSLDIPPPLVDALRSHRDYQDLERMQAGPAWSTDWDGLVFTSLTGTPLDLSNVRRDFGRATEAAGLGHWSPNELRHTAVSLLSAAGVPLEHIADVMGHEGTRMTSQVYRHLVTPSIGAAAGPMGEIFG